MFRNLWRKVGDRSKAEPKIPPIQDPPNYEAIFFALLDEVAQRSEFSRGWIRGFLRQHNLTPEKLADWLREYGERLQVGEEQRELQERLLRLGRLQEGELCRVAEVVGRRLERENRSQTPKNETESWDEAEVWFERGTECYRAGDFNGAIASYDKALDINSDLPGTWGIRGFALEALGQYEDAIASYDKALDIESDFYEAWCWRGRSLINLGRYGEAVASFDKAIDIKPDEYGAWCWRGRSLINLGQCEEAVASFDKAIDIKPDEYEAWYGRGSSLNNLGRYEEAIASFDKAIDIKPDEYEVWYNRGNPFSNLRRYEDAIANYDQGLTYVLKEADPEGWGELYQGKGNIYLYQARYNQDNQNIQAAKVHYRQAITAYNAAKQTLESFPESYLELIQRLIKAHLGLGSSEAANQWRITGLEVFRQLINAQSTPLQKRNLETKFSGFSRIAVDSLVEGETIVALETAERYKNRCLTWILDDWKEQVRSPSYAEVRQLLSSQTAIVYWHLGDDSLTTFILTPTSETPILLDNPLSYDRYQKLQSWIKTWNTQYNDYRIKKANQFDHPWRRDLTTQLAKLKEILRIQAIEAHLPNIQTLILIPHRDLHRFPIHTLFSELFAVSYLPSAQVGITQRSKPSDHTPFLLNVEDPDRGDPMPFAQLESVILNALFAPNAVTIPPEDSDRCTVEAALTRKSGIFHFTGHGNYNDHKPEDSELALKDSDTLTAKEISKLNLRNYHLVSLSACETAIAGNQSIETEYIGLTSAFLQAGVSHVISTLWTVEEVSNAYLMIRFYQNWLAGQPTAIALQLAQHWLRTRSNADLYQWLKTLLPLTTNHPGAQKYLQSHIKTVEGKIGETEPPYRDPYYWAAFTHTGL